MAWDWLTRPARPYTWLFALRVLIKGLILFALLNIAFAVVDPMGLVGRLSVYNRLVPGRERLPYGENPDQSYNLSVQNLDTLFATHTISGGQSDDEFRVLVIGDSSVWGVLLAPEETLAGQINAAGRRAPDGRRIRAYNLGYPIQSLAKDLLILDYAMRYRPDAVIWLVTLESFAPAQQLEPLMVRENPGRMRAFIRDYGLRIDAFSPRFVERTFWERTIIGQRRALADWLRLQLYGVTWRLTGHDQTYPRFYEPRMEDFAPDDVLWQGFAEGQLAPGDLAFDVLGAGLQRVRDEMPGVPVFVVNEPIFRSAGQNSALRYNFFYPRWAYDAYRGWLENHAAHAGYAYLDLWDAVPTTEFTDSAVHLTPAGVAVLAQQVGDGLVEALGR
ncbi:MAG: SGNH/GDSL hydrolase family protein [Anaerolineae bacterium]|nr:SGNH/GDSL hydrolase family protein [Anaerolineae bacterium]